METIVYKLILSVAVVLLFGLLFIFFRLYVSGDQDSSLDSIEIEISKPAQEERIASLEKEVKLMKIWLILLAIGVSGKWQFVTLIFFTSIM